MVMDGMWNCSESCQVEIRLSYADFGCTYVSFPSGDLQAVVHIVKLLWYKKLEWPLEQGDLAKCEQTACKSYMQIFTFCIGSSLARSLRV